MRECAFDSASRVPMSGYRRATLPRCVVHVVHEMMHPMGHQTRSIDVHTEKVVPIATAR
jgi:hypothetical protein